MNNMAGDKLREKRFYDLLRKRDKKAMEFLYDHYASVMYGIIVHTIRHEESAEIILTNAFLYIWKNYKEFDPDKLNVSVWIINTTRKMCSKEVIFLKFTENRNDPAVFSVLDRSKL